jgi:hypothetical protein
MGRRSGGRGAKNNDSLINPLFLQVKNKIGKAKNKQIVVF